MKRPLKFAVPAILRDSGHWTYIEVRAFTKTGAIREVQRQYNAKPAQKYRRHVRLAE